MPIGQLCAQVGCDYKQLERSFLAVIGLRPKFVARLMRFAAVFDSLNTASPDVWLQAAFDSGYYDQAHFTKEFKAFTGVPPSQFLVQPTSITAMLSRSPDAAQPVSNPYKTSASVHDRLRVSLQ